MHPKYIYNIYIYIYILYLYILYIYYIYIYIYIYISYFFYTVQVSKHEEKPTFKQDGFCFICLKTFETAHDLIFRQSKKKPL